MLGLWMILVAICLLGFSGVPGCLRASRAGQRAAVGLMVIGGVLGLAGVVLSMRAAEPPSLHAPWGLPWGRFAVAVDSLSALFLLPVFIVPALGAVFGLGYWNAADHPDNVRRLGLSYGLLAAAMGLVVIARDGVFFLVAWEVMALAAYFAAVVEDDRPEVCQAGWVYLVATHIGTLVLIAMFTLWRQNVGSFALDPAVAIGAETAGWLFALALIGFGFKAGLMPLHVWLPGAHANAPSHVSAVMSGVMLKMGVYGLMRMTALLPVSAAWWGGTLLAVGAGTAVMGIAFAIGQRDLKRMLAYSSIENIGIIAMGLGLALLGRALGHPVWVWLGLGGALLHVWNHSLFKALLFLNAGAIIHATHTREMDRLGGLARRMPRVTGLFVVGAIAICALPPLNGFAGEWMLYVGLFHTLDAGANPGMPAAALAAVALAMTGALAVACFVKALGTIFLGLPRGQDVTHARDPAPSLLAPMFILAGACLAIGLFPAMTMPWLRRATMTWASLPLSTLPAADLASLNAITATGCMLLIVAGWMWWTLRRRFRDGAAVTVGTWDCGYARPAASMQYTGSSLGQWLVSLWSFVLWPEHRGPVVRGFFASTTARFRQEVPDTVLDRLVRPGFALVGRYLPRLRVLQQGQTHVYVLYILIAVVALLAGGGNP